MNTKDFAQAMAFFVHDVFEYANKRVSAKKPKLVQASKSLESQAAAFYTQSTDASDRALALEAILAVWYAKAMLVPKTKPIPFEQYVTQCLSMDGFETDNVLCEWEDCLYKPTQIVLDAVDCLRKKYGLIEKVKDVYVRLLGGSEKYLVVGLKSVCVEGQMIVCLELKDSLKDSKTRYISLKAHSLLGNDYEFVGE